MPARQTAIGTHGHIDLGTGGDEVESAKGTEQIHYSKAIAVSFCLT